MGKFIGTQMIEVEKLKEHPLNEKFNPPTQKEFDELIKSLKDIGQINPIVVNKDFIILAGHWKYKALKDVLGQKKVEVKIFDGTPKEEVQILIDDNKVRRNITPDAWVNIEKQKYLYWNKEDFFDDYTFSVKVKNILLDYKDKISKDFLAYLATLDHTQQILVVNELQMIFELEQERFEKVERELTQKDYECYHEINKEHADKVKKFTEVQEKINESKELVNFLQEKVKESEKEIEMLKEDKIRLEEQIKELIKEKKTSIDSEKINNEIKELKKQIKEKDSKINIFEKELIESQMDLDNLRKKYEKLVKEKDKIIAEQVRDVKERYRKMMTELEKKMEDKEKEIEEMRKKFEEELIKLTPKFYKFTNVNNYLSLLTFIKEKCAVATATVIERIEYQKNQASKGIFNQDENEIDAVLFGDKFIDESAETIYFILSQLISLYQNTGLFKKKIKKVVEEILNITTVLDKSKEKI